jgi:hypothetical protein
MIDYFISGVDRKGNMTYNISLLRVIVRSNSNNDIVKRLYREFRGRGRTWARATGKEPSLCQSLSARMDRNLARRRIWPV